VDERNSVRKSFEKFTRGCNTSDMSHYEEESIENIKKKP
jgi:hypothetical protein